MIGLQISTCVSCRTCVALRVLFFENESRDFFLTKQSLYNFVSDFIVGKPCTILCWESVFKPQNSNVDIINAKDAFFLCHHVKASGFNRLRCGMQHKHSIGRYSNFHD